MEYPKQLRIGYRNYQVNIAKGAEIAMMGGCDHLKHRINVNIEDIPSETANTLLHEALHCIYDINLPSTEEYKKIEEEVVTQLTHGLIQMIQDNPKAIEFIINAANNAGIEQSTG